MSQEKHEALSALVDGELPDHDGPRLLDLVLEDVSLKRRWTTYHLIGDVMRKHVIDQQSTEAKTEGGAGAISPFPAKNGTVARRRTRGIGPVAGLALAASVAAAAVIGMFAVSGPQRTPEPVAESVAPIRVAVSSGPESPSVVAGSALGIDPARLTWNDASPAVSTRLNGYLVTHNEYLANGMRGMMPYARIVAYDGVGN